MNRILVLTNNGMGLYLFRKELILELVKKYTVYISLPHGDHNHLLIDLGCKLIHTPMSRRGTNLFADFKLLLTYIKNMIHIKPEIVLTYTVKPNVYGGLACRILSVPYIANITGLGSAVQNEGFLNKFVLYLYKIGLKKASCVFFQNRQNQQLFMDKRIVKDNSRLIPGSGVNLEVHNLEEYPDDSKGVSLLFIGRLMKDKGIGELLDAASIIKDKYPNVKFHLIGSMEDDYTNQIHELEEQGILKYHGYQEDVHSFIKASHATVLPSYHEGTANVLLESASTARPVLASRVAGCIETFDEGVSGFGFKVKSVDSLVETLIHFIETPFEIKKAIGLAGRRKMESEYDRGIVVEEYLNEINKITGRMEE
jgi:galacturonosyltransferase